MAAFSRVEDETPNSLHSSCGVSWMITEASLHSLRFNVPPYRQRQKPSSLVPCPISLPAASHILLSSHTSDISFLFICLFLLSLPSRAGIFFFKSCLPPRSKWFLLQSFSPRKAKQRGHLMVLISDPNPSLHNLQLSCTKPPIVPVN